MARQLGILMMPCWCDRWRTEIGSCRYTSQTLAIMCGREQLWIWRRGCAGPRFIFRIRAIPMLPPQLSTGICSLRPDEDRLVLSCVMEIDGRGEVLGYEVCEGIIRSAKRLTYTQVQAILDSGTDAATDVDKAVRAEFVDFVIHFERMHELALKLNGKRKRRGSIDFDLP